MLLNERKKQSQYTRKRQKVSEFQRDRKSQVTHKNKETFNLNACPSYPTTITIGNLKKENLFLRILLDTGCSDSLIQKKWEQYGKKTKNQEMKFMTGNGIKVLDESLTLTFTLCEFTNKRNITWRFIIDDSNHGYDMIIGRDLLCELGLQLDFDKRLIKWQGMELSMRMPDKNLLQENHMNETQHNFLAHEYTLESEHSLQATDRIQEILDMESNENIDLIKWVDEIPNINENNRSQLLTVLQSNMEIFRGDLGIWNCSPVDIEVKEGATPFATRPYPVPKIHEEKLQSEIQRFIDLGILKRTLNSEWAAPAFLIPKKDGKVRFICDFRQLNERIKKKPYPIPAISELLGKMEQFTYVTAIDVSLGYHHIRLTKKAQELCTITTPYGLYSYTRLPMGLATAPSIFQDKIHELLEDLPYTRAYIDDILIISFKDASDHIQKLGVVLNRLRMAGLKIKPDKVQLLKSEMIYLGYKITTNGIAPDPAKVKAILNIDRPKNMKQVKAFIGLIQYYRDIWPRRSHILAPIVDLTKGYDKKKKLKPIKWTPQCEKAFQEIKAVVAKETLLAFPNFKEKFVIHTDASDTQLGAVISQEGRPLAFYSRKLTQAQKNYTVTEKELLSIVETLKEFRTILLGFEIVIYTDHVNLTYKSTLSDSQRVMRWRMIIEEFAPTIKYIKGEANTVADSLSRLPLIYDAETKENSKILENQLHEVLAHEEDTSSGFPLHYTRIRKEQEKELQKDNKLKEEIEKDEKSGKARVYGTKMYDNERLITYRNRIYVPKSLQHETINWYHWMLRHPGKMKLEKTLQMHCFWPNMSLHILQYTRTCKQCQMYKKRYTNYGKLPPKQLPLLQPWEEVAIDLIGPYKISAKQRQLDGTIKPVNLVLCAMTMIDTSTGWFEIKEVPTAPYIKKTKVHKTKKRQLTKDNTEQITATTIMDKSSARMSQIFDQVWLSRYPRPKRVLFDNGSEFKLDFLQLLQDYGIKAVTTSVKNPQSNSILERVHQVIHNMVRTQELKKLVFDAFEPWNQILAQTAFAIRSSYHRILEASPAQLVYQRDMILNIAYYADWATITAQKQRQINKDNAQENKKRVAHDYKVGEKVLIKPDGVQRKYEWQYEGPYEITEVHTNGTVIIQRNAFTERINIRRLVPFIEEKIQDS